MISLLGPGPSSADVPPPDHPPSPSRAAPPRPCHRLARPTSAAPLAQVRSTGARGTAPVLRSAGSSSAHDRRPPVRMAPDALAPSCRGRPGALFWSSPVCAASPAGASSRPLHARPCGRGDAPLQAWHDFKRPQGDRRGLARGALHFAASSTTRAVQPTQTVKRWSNHDDDQQRGFLSTYVETRGAHIC